MTFSLKYYACALCIPVRLWVCEAIHDADACKTFTEGTQSHLLFITTQRESSDYCKWLVCRLWPVCMDSGPHPDHHHPPHQQRWHYGRSSTCYMVQKQSARIYHRNHIGMSRVDQFSNVCWALRVCTVQWLMICVITACGAALGK